MKDLLQDEKDNKEDKNDKSGTVGGLWLKRWVVITISEHNCKSTIVNYKFI